MSEDARTERAGVEIRVAERSDVAALLGLMAQLYEHEGIPFAEAKLRGALLQLLEEPVHGLALVMRAGRVLAGYLVLTMGFSLERGGRYGLLDELYVGDAFRGQGLGTAAVQRAVAECRRLGVKTLLLEAEQENEAAVRLYARLGFRAHTRHLMYREIEALP